MKGIYVHRISVIHLFLLFFATGATYAVDRCAPTSIELSKIVADLEPSVFAVWPKKSKYEKLMGTATLIDDRGYFLTAWHVVKHRLQDNQKIILKSPELPSSGREYFDVSLYDHDEYIDMAILKAEDNQWNDSYWIAKQGPFLVRYLSQSEAFKGFYIGYGKRKFEQSTLDYSTDKLDAKYNAKLYLSGKAAGGDSGSILLDSSGIGVAIAVEKNGGDFIAIALNNALDLFSKLPLSKAGENLLKGVLARTNPTKLIVDFKRGRKVAAIEIYNILERLKQIEKSNPDEFKHFYLNNGIVEFTKAANEACLESIIWAMNFEIIRSANLSDRSALLKVLSSKDLRQGVISFKRQVKNGSTEFSKAAEQGLALAINQRINQIKSRNTYTTTWNTVNYSERISESNLISEVSDLTRFLNDGDKGRLDPSIYLAEKNAKNLLNDSNWYAGRPIYDWYENDQKAIFTAPDYIDPKNWVLDKPSMWGYNPPAGG